MSSSKEWNRRDFLQVGAGALAVGILAGCEVPTQNPDAPPSSSKTPPDTTKTPGVKTPPTDTSKQALTSKVYVVKTTDRRAGIRRLFELAGTQWANGRDILLKPNLVSNQKFPTTTHDDTLREVASTLRKAGCKDITLGESAGLGRTKSVLSALKTGDLCKELKLSLVNFDDLPQSDWQDFQFQGMHWDGNLALPKMFNDKSKAIVLLPCCKTHSMGGHFTMSMKLAVGMTPVGRRSEMHSSNNLREWVADINAGFKPDFILMDAMSVFISGGPTSGEEAHPNLLVAGTDRVAVDAVGVAILKQAGVKTEPVKSKKIFEQEQIKRAMDIKLTTIRGPENIEIVGDDKAVVQSLQDILKRG